MRTTRRIVIAVALAMAACTGPEPPTCYEAVAHYYAVGCVHYDGPTGEPLSLGETVERCELLRAVVLTDACVEAVEAWIFCIDTAPSGTEVGCDCERERETIRVCDG